GGEWAAIVEKVGEGVEHLLGEIAAEFRWVKAQKHCVEGEERMWFGVGHGWSAEGGFGDQATFGGDVHGVGHLFGGQSGGAAAGAGEAIIAATSDIVGGIGLGGFDPAGGGHALDGAIERAGAEARVAFGAGSALLSDA